MTRHEDAGVKRGNIPCEHIHFAAVGPSPYISKKGAMNYDTAS